MNKAKQGEFCRVLFLESTLIVVKQLAQIRGRIVYVFHVYKYVPMICLLYQNRSM